ncbi:hypothetical protein SAMN05192574_102911 [Mucilaginibacter gossypiicola]|uniref:Uncharacterized protein n=1 Tax=Mucilaginibacter gossypiicola TaxID=551995 RepID=A0A1H8F065_9SPHI|nr:hypothetical protein [Mucilaginibacter gossypiicola]SEN25142.1 hypothetical protein SAMN05192574_102911 [Mucilaginibacter gossypiicola]
MNTKEKFKLAKGNAPKGVQHPENFTMNEFIAREQATQPKGKKYLFYLLIVLTLLWAIIKLPYTILIGIYNRFKPHS